MRQGARVVAVVFLFLAACTSNTADDGGVPDSGSPNRTADAGVDAGMPADAGMGDSGTPDAGAPTVPGTPTAVSATGGDAQASVSWSAPADNGRSALTGFVVTPYTGGTAGTPVSVSGALATQKTLTGLTNGTAYTFTVAAVNAVGTGPESTPSNAVTPAVPPPLAAPTSVTAVAGNAQATLIWSAPSDSGGGSITGYSVTATPGGLVFNVGVVTSLRFYDLANGTPYTFTVKAQNSLGATSAASAASTAVTPVWKPGTPKNVVATRGNASATVSFTPPSDTGGSPITGYAALFSDGGTAATATSAATSVSVTGLTNGQMYQFSMVALNAQGASLASGMTPPTVPGSGSGPPDAPAGVAGYADNASAYVFWTAPNNNGGSVVTQYKVSSSPVTTTQTSTTPWIHFSGLTNGTAYTFTVKAHNSTGDSTASSASGSLTPSAAPAVCSTAGSTSATGNVHNGCAILTRDTSSCASSRTALGLSGFWLKFSCRVTLSTQTVNGVPGVKLVSDGQPDYQSVYWTFTDPCHDYFSPAFPDPGFIASTSFVVAVPLTPSGASTVLNGMVGMALNGAYLFSDRAAPGDDIYNEVNSFDECQGHPNQTGYHYHSEPYSISYDDASFVGIMRDGYPIYGRRDNDGTIPSLDAYGGHAGFTADSPSTAVYHYHLSEQTSSTTSSLGTKSWFISTGTSKAAPGTCTGCTP